MDRILPYILATLTQHNRQKVEIVWCKENWVSNIFRLWELVFWRREGIRAEATTSGYIDENGHIIEVHQYHTLEAFLGGIEGFIRVAFKRLRFPKIVKVYIPQFAPVGIYKLPSSSPYLFAIAFDAADGNNNAFASVTTVNITHVSTGSNLLMVLNGGTLASTNGNSVTHTSFTYNSVSSTNAQTQAGNQSKVSLWYLVAPTTGSHTATFTIATTLTGSGNEITAIVTTYTGCAQTGQPDSSNKNSVVSSVNPFPVTTTVVASNCWLSGGALDENTFNGSTTPGTGTHYQSAIQFNQQVADSNGTVGTGSQSLNWGESTGGSHVIGAVMSIAPAAAAVNSNFLMFL